MFVYFPILITNNQAIIPKHEKLEHEKLQF